MNKSLKNVVAVRTGDLLENKNKINERDICTNASNFGVQNSAITLIALIITIIVLLILAGVTLNMVMGENGIFGKANNAKDKTEVAQYEEELRMCVLELQTDAAANGTTFNMDTIKNKFVEKVKELENTTEIEFPTKESETRLEGTYKGYEFYIDDKYAAHIGDKATGISLTTNLEPSGWTQGPVTATITIKSNNGISKVEPDEGSKNGNNEYIITKENITENTSFEYTVTDGQGNTQTKTAVINTIDRLEPKEPTITTKLGWNKIIIDTLAEDELKTETNECSGIDYYNYEIKSPDNSSNVIEKQGKEYTILNPEVGKYTIKVTVYDKAGNSKTSQSISIDYKDQTIEMIGKNIDYSVTVNDQTMNKWKIFDCYNGQIYLIADEFVKNYNLPETKNGNKPLAVEGYTYRANMYNSEILNDYEGKTDNFTSKIKEINNKENKLFGYINNLGYNNIKMVEYMLDTEIWNKFINKYVEEKVDFAIGAPTIELFADSWKKTHDFYEFSYSYNNNNIRYGYDIRYTNSLFDGYKNPKISLDENEQNELYTKNSLTQDYDPAGMNMAVPYDFQVADVYTEEAKENMILVTIKSSVRWDFGRNCGFRPVIALKEGVELEWDENKNSFIIK